MSNDWLQTIYKEAWNQYCHEDNLGVRRNTLYLGVQAAFIAILTGLAAVLLKSESGKFGMAESARLAILGVFTATFAYYSIKLTDVWQSVAQSGRVYLNLRWAVAKRIELKANLKDIGLAESENRWRRSPEFNERRQYRPYPDIQELSEIEIGPFGKYGGWPSIVETIKIVRRIWLFIFIVGSLLICQYLIYILASFSHFQLIAR